ncbi:acyl CoA binding protein-domain-containing protein [Thamnidium elegans]|nr:acyl CoA binding protein-domain-containing protein [Thamnidium elegans]
MANIPPHYTDRFILQRYNKALHIVQNLPASSNFQPTKSQKLELYSLYKQVSQGDINTQRPGLFDVVGRAKDAWKKLEGITVLEARHIYVESLLRVAAEAYKKNIGREEAQQIIHTFAIMRPSGDDDSDDLDTDDTSNQEDDDDDDEDEEEQAYLRDIQESSNGSSLRAVAPDRQRLTSPVLSRSNNHRPSSVASVRTMVTAPTTRPPSAANSVTSGVRSTRFGPSNYRGNEKRPQHMTRDVLPENKDTFIEEEFDHSVNPWQHIPTTHSNKNIQSTSSSEDSIENNRSNNTKSSNLLRLPSPMFNRQQQQQQRLSSLASPSPPPYPQHLQIMTPIHQNQYNQSPVPGSSTSSSVTATPQLHNMAPGDRSVYTPTDSRSVSRTQSRYDTSQQYTSVVALGPATKRALESLQSEIIALNERIDDLRKELVERDRQRAIKRKSDTEEETEPESDDMGDGWKWVIKAALKYASVNLMTGFILFFILYKSRSPIAYAVLKQTGKYWQTFRLRALISNVVV